MVIGGEKSSQKATSEAQLRLAVELKRSEGLTVIPTKRAEINTHPSLLLRALPPRGRACDAATNSISPTTPCV